jgi:hypothetical protein
MTDMKISGAEDFSPAETRYLKNGGCPLFLKFPQDWGIKGVDKT